MEIPDRAHLLRTFNLQGPGLGEPLGRMHNQSYRPHRAQRWPNFNLNEERNPARTDLRHVGGVLRVGAEKAFLDEAFDEHPENGDGQERGIARTVDSQKNGQIAQISSVDWARS